MAFAVYEISINPRVQAAVLEEVDRCVLSGGLEAFSVVRGGLRRTSRQSRGVGQG
jgi:hypothetical protein